MICLHLVSGAREYACARHLTIAREELATNDTVVSAARCSEKEGNCAWC